MAKKTARAPDRARRKVTGGQCWKCGAPSVMDKVFRKGKLVSVCASH